MIPGNRLTAGLAAADISPARAWVNYSGKPVAPPPPDHLPLEAIVCFLSYGEIVVGLAAIDCINVSASLVDSLRSRLDLAGFIVGATHSHCAPHLAPMFLAGSAPDAAYEDHVVEQLLDAFGRARDMAEPVQLRAGHAGSPGYEFCRRYRRPGGGVVTTLASDEVRGLPPCGATDPEVPFWLFETSNGAPKGIVLSYPCHMNAARAPFMTPDIAGFCRKALREQCGASLNVLVLAGACGDVTWLDPAARHPGGIEHAERIGRALAERIVEAIPDAATMAVDRLECRRETLRIPDRAPEESEYCEDGCRGSTPEELAVQQKRYGPERDAVKQRGNTSMDVELDALVLGSTALVSNPAELFCHLGMRIRRQSPFPVTLIAELANGYAGYLPGERDFEEGGYETHRSVHTSRLVKWAGETIVERSLHLLHEGS